MVITDVDEYISIQIWRVVLNIIMKETWDYTQ